MEEPITLYNLKAAENFRENLPKAFMKIRKEADKYNSSERNVFETMSDELEAHFNSREEAKEAYRDLEKTEKEILEHAMYETEEISSQNVKELGLIYKQISFTARLADTEQYEIPIVTEDEVIALHLQVVHAEDGKGTVEISMNQEKYGRLSARIQIFDGEVSGIYLDSQKEEKESLSDLKVQIKEGLSKNGFAIRDAFEGREDIADKDAEYQTSTKELYRAAKTIIGVIRRQVERG